MQKFAKHSGLLVVGHGSREEIGLREFLATVDLMRTLADGTPVEPCFLEFAEPTIGAGFRRLVERGVRDVIVSPVLLFAAGHAKRDIPEAVAAAVAQSPGVTARLAEHLGSAPGLLALSQQRYEEALGRANRAERDFTKTTLVLVGRGSHDPESTAEMHAFADARARDLQSADERAPAVEVAFVAMAEPRLAQVLEQLADSAPRRIVVQPHLLFGGVLLDRIGDVVREFAGRSPQHEWITTGHLGPHSLVAEALVSRAATAPERRH